MPSNRPPDPSKPDKLQQMIQTEINKFLSDPDKYPDPMVSWLNSFISLTISSVGSITG